MAIETGNESGDGLEPSTSSKPSAAVTTNRAAFLGLVFGAIAVLVAGLFGVMGALAIVFSAVGLSRSNRMAPGAARSTARRRSISGLILGGISVVLTLVVVALLAAGSQLHLDSKLMESEIAKSSALISTVRCPTNPPAIKGRKFTCVASLTTGGTAHVNVTVVNGKGEIHWRVG